MVKDHVRGVAQAPSQVDQGAVSELVDLEDTIIDVSDTVDVILKHVDAEGVSEAWERKKGQIKTRWLPASWTHYLRHWTPSKLTIPAPLLANGLVIPRLQGPQDFGFPSPHLPSSLPC